METLVLLLFAVGPVQKLTPEQAARLSRLSSALPPEKVLETLAEVYGRWHAIRLGATERLARRERGRREWKQEAAWWSEAALVAERLLGRAAPRAVDARWAAKVAEARAGWNDKQHADFERAATLSASVKKAGDADEPAEALAKAEEALRLARGLFTDAHPFTIACLNDHGAAMAQSGRTKEGTTALTEALRLTRATLGESHPHYAESLFNLAQVHRMAGDHRAGLPLLREAVSLTARNEANRVRALSALSSCHLDAGEHRAALASAKKASLLCEGGSLAGSRHQADALRRLGQCFAAMGNDREGLDCARRAIALGLKAHGSRSVALGVLHNDHGMLLRSAGDLKGALDAFQKARRTFKDALGEKSAFYAGAMGNAASVLHQMGRRDQALPLQREAVRLTGVALGKKHPLLADRLNELAILHLVAGEAETALPLLRDSLAIYLERFGERHPRVAASRSNQATALLALGKPRDALPLAEQALAAARDRLRDDGAAQSDRQQIEAASSFRLRLHLRLSVPDDKGHPPAVAHVLAWKGALAVRSRQQRLFARLATDPATRDLAEQARELARRLAALKQMPDPGRAIRQAAEKELDAVQARLSSLATDFAADRAEASPSPEAVAARLPKGTVLVDYLFHEAFAPKSPTLWEDRLTAFVHQRGAPPARVDLGLARPIIEEAVEWRADLVAGRAGGARLKRLMWTPLEKHLEGADTVLVSPDGALGLVPFAALPGKKEGRTSSRMSLSP